MLFTPRSLSRRNVSAPFVCGGGGVSLFRQPSSHADGGGDDDELATLVTPHGTQTGRPHAVVMPLPFRWALHIARTPPGHYTLLAWRAT